MVAAGLIACALSARCRSQTIAVSDEKKITVFVRSRKFSSSFATMVGVVKEWLEQPKETKMDYFGFPKNAAGG